MTHASPNFENVLEAALGLSVTQIKSALLAHGVGPICYLCKMGTEPVTIHGCNE